MIDGELELVPGIPGTLTIDGVPWLCRSGCETPMPARPMSNSTWMRPRPPRSVTTS